MAITPQTWVDMADMGDEEREQTMLDHYKEVASLAEEERQAEMLASADLVYDLPDEKLKAMTISRLNVWLQLEDDIARTVANSYDQMANQLSGKKAMRRVALTQTLAHEFSLGNQERLAALVPKVFGRSTTAGAVAAARAEASTQTQAQAPKRKKLFGIF